MTPFVESTGMRESRSPFGAGTGWRSVRRAEFANCAFRCARVGRLQKWRRIRRSTEQNGGAQA